MKWKAITPQCLPVQDLEEDFRQARDVGGVRLGGRCLYLVKLSGVGYLPYQQVERAWLRQEEVNANLCCGRTNLDQFFLMVQDQEGKTHKAQVISKALGKEALALIAQANPQVEIGYQKGEAAV